MKKIYSLIDQHTGTIIVSSYTQDILEEIMCDDFMECYQYEMQSAADNHFIDPINPTEDCRVFAQDTWNSILRWYKEVYDIQENILI